MKGGVKKDDASKVPHRLILINRMYAIQVVRHLH